MEHIWSPWRYRYVASLDRPAGCVFCRALEGGDDRAALILHRGQSNYVILNLFPYTSGHLMIVPYSHIASLADADEATTAEMMELAKQAQKAVESEYRPDGFNIGLNLGRAAGAGVAEHLHLHVVARWSGDANFLSVIGETRVLPEEVETTYQRLKKYFS
jgi:ATP adenylyltransferase